MSGRKEQKAMANVTHGDEGCVNGREQPRAAWFGTAERRHEVVPAFGLEEGDKGVVECRSRWSVLSSSS